MKEKSVFFVALLIAVLIAVVTTTIVFAATSYTYSFVNMTHKPIYVEIKTEYDIDAYDNIHKSFTVAPGGTVHTTLNKGTYWVYYYSCAVDNPGTDRPFDYEINLDSDIEAVIYPCDAKPTWLNVRNHTPETIDLDITNKVDEESYDVEPGLTQISVFSGENFYNYDACDSDLSGVIDVHPAGTTQLILPSCEVFVSPEYIYGASNIANFNFINHASFPLILTIIGPMNDLIEISPGINRADLVVGVYTYSYYIDYEVISGTFIVTPNGIGALLLSPEYTIDNGLLVEEEFE